MFTDNQEENNSKVADTVDIWIIGKDIKIIATDIFMKIQDITKHIRCGDFHEKVKIIK